MARPEARKKKGFYPYPPNLWAPLAKWLHVPNPETTTIADPCAGEGDVLDDFHKTFGIPKSNIYANELDYERYLACKQKGVNSVCGDAIFQLHTDRTSLAFVNPPYDKDGFSGGRSETPFFNLTPQLLNSKGVAVFVLPFHIVSRFTEFPNYFKELRVLLFPPEDYERFRQCVVIGYYYRGERVGEKKSWEHQLKHPGCLTDTPDHVYTVPSCRPMRPEHFFSDNLSEDIIQDYLKMPDVRHMLASGLNKTRLDTMQTLMPLKQSHKALMMATGYLDGVYVDPETSNILLVAGKTERREMNMQLDESDDPNVVKRVIECPDPKIYAWDLTASLQANKVILYEFS